MTRLRNVTVLSCILIVTAALAACESDSSSPGVELTTATATVTATPTTTPTEVPLASTTPESDPTDVSDDGEFRVDERLRFAEGSTAGTVTNAVIRGERDRYIVGASAGQTMTVVLSSLESNAVADLVAPDGTVLFTELDQTEVTLPSTGDYQIIVSGTRGNANYDLTVTITPVP